MPTYEYRCKQCGHELEAQQSFSDDPLTTCPECNEPALKKVFGTIAVTFKGSGFYKTDSRSGSSSTSSDSSSDSASSGDTKTDTKTETTSASKADTPAPAAAAS